MTRYQRYITHAQLCALLKKTLEGRPHGSWAEAHGVNQAVVSLVLHGHREIPDSLAQALGYTKQTFYVKKEA